MATYAQQANSGKDPSNSGGHSNSGGGNSANHSSSYSSASHANHNNSNINSSHHNIPTDGSKKEEFRKYLEKAGVLDALTKVLVGLYEEPERPNNAIEYIKRYLGAPKNIDVEGLKRENDQLRRQVVALSLGDNNADTRNNAGNTKALAL
mmetsp:Transcript_8892/g.21745  ORF Transcript_8892/g.21745 Transcript_8892/m.21745 type:complete len:150 (-) Transcript_8892:2779-3228(-)